MNHDNEARPDAQGSNREAIAESGEELGILQLTFLQEQGLQPDHYVLDVGCGAMRAGAKLARFLDPGRYFGIDRSRALLDAGRRELERAGVSEKVPHTNLKVTSQFDVVEFPRFAFGIAQSVFTHERIFLLAHCLHAIRINFEPPATFFATFFIAPPGAPETVQHPGGINTFADRDPYHHSVQDVMVTAHAVGWRAELIGNWGHPRNEQMFAFTQDPDGYRS